MLTFVITLSIYDKYLSFTVSCRHRPIRLYVQKEAIQIQPVKAVPLQAWSGPQGSRKLRFPDFITTAQDGRKVSALRTGRLYPQEIHLVLISVRG